MKYLQIMLCIYLFFPIVNIKAVEKNPESEDSLYEIAKNQNLNTQRQILFEPLLNGQKLKLGMQLPDGYEWLPNGGLKFPNQVYLNNDGSLILPDDEYPESLTIKSDGTIITKDNIQIIPQIPNNLLNSQIDEDLKDKKLESIEDLLAGINDKYKSFDQDNVKNVKEDKEKIKTKPQNKPKNGDKFTIPEDALQKGNLDFLEGCWKSDMYLAHTWETGAKHPVYARYCFDRKGRGQRYIYDRGEVYSGAITAIINKSQLAIKTGRAYGGKRYKEYTPITVKCNGSENTTQCIDTGVNPKNPRDIHTRNIVLRREL